MGKGADVERRPLGQTGLEVTPLAFGAFKIGRNEGIKYPESYPLPSDREAAHLLDGILDRGINLIDTAPAYGCSEERIGRHIAGRRSEFLLSSKVGEQWNDGRSIYDFSPKAIRDSVQGSLRRLHTDHLDLLLLHSDGSDLELQRDGVLPELLTSIRDAGLARTVGFSGKTIDGMHAALEWSDVVMLEYNLDNTAMEPVIRSAADQGIGVLIKKGLGSGHLDAEAALEFLMNRSPVSEGISSIVIGSRSLERMHSNADIISRLQQP